MSWLQLNVTVTNGSKTVTVHNGASTAKVRTGDALVMPGFSPVEIAGVFATTLQLANTWSSATQNTAACAIMPTFGDFDSAAATMCQFTQTAQGNFAAMEKWWTEQGLVEFKGFDNEVHQVRTAKQMDDDVKAIEDKANALVGDISGIGYLRTEAEFEASRELARHHFAGSGMIHAGLGHDNGNDIKRVNEGLYSFNTAPNAFFLGRDLSVSPNYVGESETEHPVFNLTGIAAHVKGLNTVPSESPSHARFILPKAPRGTEVYNPDTGVLTDYATEIDPKYGNVASNDEEAIERAFGVFKAGDTVFLAGNATYDFSTKELTHPQLASGITLQGIPVERTTMTLVVSSSRYCEYSVKDSTSGAAADPTLTTFSIEPGEEKKLVLDLAGRKTTGVYLRLDNGANPATTTLHFVGVTAGEVVTQPVDLVGFEWFLRPITQEDPILYPNGIQQCKLTSVDGIPTVENTFRPMSHFEVYPGDTTSRGRGFNIYDGSLTEEQLKAEFQKKPNNVYRMPDGTIAQWTLSQRTIRGLGNGDWLTATSQGNGITSANQILTWSTHTRSRVGVRGNRNQVASVVGGGSFYCTTGFDSYNPDPEVGMFTGNQGDAYFYVVTRVPRMNQGARHDSFNANGTALSTDNGTPSNPAKWWEKPTYLQSTFDCFRFTRSPKFPNSGQIGGVSGHPEGKHHDAIYADGMNGIIDCRQSAYPSDSVEQSAKIFQKVVSGEYRGLEKGYLCERGFIRDVSGTGGGRLIKTDNYRGLSSPCGYSNPRINGVYLYIYNITKGQGHAVDNNSNQYGWLYPVNSPVFGNPSLASWEVGDEVFFLGPNVPNSPLIPESWLVPYSQSGEILMMDVMAHPAVIPTIPQLAQGWFGGWIDTIPDGTPKNFSTTRKALTTPSQTYSSNGGDTWSYYSTLQNGWSETTSTRVGVSYPAGSIDIWHYRVNAFQTKPANNVSVLNFHKGILPVWYSMETSKIRGNCLTESLLGQWSKNSAAVLNGGWAPLKMYSLTQIGVFDTNSTYKPMPTHEKVPLGTPNNSSIAIKVLPYQVSKNQECSLNFAFAELKHDGTDWGDNGQLPITSNVSTYTNDNGVLCLYGTHTLAIPYGFSKNRARPGTQTKGVEL
ncbi:hypothetical protein [Vibrio furnissii]|uniref:hypothetical protein n=1 Tax=Vibrio furnissii TaxID=29494 RepID=UPI001EEA075B|nr:hypothetical protein [Vibrio furnissii]MCG6268267.1 hypothetical protein [Vibrio furnissii]